jgi:hypothetical protein
MLETRIWSQKPQSEFFLIIGPKRKTKKKRLSKHAKDIATMVNLKAYESPQGVYNLFGLEFCKQRICTRKYSPTLSWALPLARIKF